MNFLAPMAFFFAAAIPVVVLFYLLKRKRVVRLVPSTVFWQKFLADTQANAPFQRLRHNWLLILQVLLLILAVLALSRPYLAGKPAEGRLVVVILDASASMQSTDETPSRFEKARQEALKLVEGLRDQDQMAIFQAGALTEVKQSPTREKAALRRALQACTPSDAPARMNEAFKLAETLTSNNPQAEIYLFSDGGFGGSLDEFEHSALPLIYHQVGKSSDNVAITAMDLRMNPENPRRREVFVQVSNFATAPQQTELELYLEDTLIEVRNVRLKERGSAAEVFWIEQERDAIFTARLTIRDDLAVDNQASLVSLLPRPVRVLLVSAGNRFLERAILAAGEVELSLASSYTGSEPQFDLVVLDNITPVVWPGDNLLVFNAVHPEWFSQTALVEGPPIVDWRKTHPLLHFVSFDDVFVAQGLVVTPPFWAVPLVDSTQAALMLAGERGAQRIVWAGFDLLQSTWPLRVSFPMFMANAVGWLNPLTAAMENVSLQPGDPLRLVIPGVREAAVRVPDGRSRPAAVNRESGEIIFAETARQGIYRLKTSDRELAFCVNLLNADESDTTPREEIQMGKYVSVGATELRRANLEIWRWIAALGLAVLLFEWWYYHRRTA